MLVSSRQLPAVRASVLAFLAVLVSLACNSPPRDFLRVGTDVDAGSLDPRLMRDTTAYRVVDLIYDGLVALDATLTPVPALATRWETPDEATWIFHLRDDATFHDGTPLTAHDVVHTFETLLDPAFGATLRTLYAPIERVSATDDYTVRFELSHPYTPLLSYLDIGIVPRHTTETVGSGPYRLEQWDRGTRIVLTAYADHWSGAPSIPRIELLVVPDNTARAQAFEAGDLDLIQSPLSPQDVSRLTSDDRFESFVTDGPSITYLNFNTAKSPLDDARLRRAIAMLIDQETIVQEIYEGADEPASSILLPTSWAYTDEIRQPSYDPESAAAILREIGPVALEIGTHSEDLNRVQTVELLQNAFREHGVDVELRISDWPSFSVRRDAGDFDLILLGWTQLVDPDRVMFEQLHTDGGLNWGGYSNQELDDLLEEGRTVSNRDKRGSIYRRAARIIAAELPYYVLSYQSYQLFTTPRLLGYEPDPRGMLRSLASSRLAP